MVNDFDQLNAYLESKDEKYYIPDHNLDNAKIVIFEMCPTTFDLKAKASVSALKTYHGLDLFDEVTDFEKGCIGTAYIANVPLYGTDKETFKLQGPIESVRLSRHPSSEYLCTEFKKKIQKIVENETTRLIAYKLEIFERYYNDFLANAEPEIKGRLQERLENGSLKILHFPAYRIDQIKTYEKWYNDFKSAFDEIIN